MDTYTDTISLRRDIINDESQSCKIKLIPDHVIVQMYCFL